MAADLLSATLQIRDVRRGAMVNDRQVPKESELTLETLRELNRVHILLKRAERISTRCGVNVHLDDRTPSMIGSRMHLKAHK
jgi:hypothetical protein